MEKVQSPEYVRLKGVSVVTLNNAYRGGAVILCKDNWRCYDSAQNKVVTCIWSIPEKYEDAVIMNSATVSKGDLIMHNEKFYFVEKSLAKCIIAFCAESGHRRIIPPTKTEDGWVFHKIIPWVTILWQHQEETFVKRVGNDRIAYSFQYGSAIKCGEHWRIYEKETQKVADLQGVPLFCWYKNKLNNIDVMRLIEAIRMNKPILYYGIDWGCMVPIASPKEGAVIVYDEEYYFAVRKVDNGIKALNVGTGELRIIPPVRTIQGDTYWIYITVEELSKNPESGEFDVSYLEKAMHTLHEIGEHMRHIELPV